MLAGGEKSAKPLARFGAQSGFAKSDRVEAKRQGAVADHFTR